MFDPKLKEALGRVQKPGRYTGGEPGSIYKEKDKVDVRFAFCFPDTYEVGMSFLGEKILYELLNSHENWWCERAFMPWLDMKAEMERLQLPLYTMESKDPLTAFDAVAPAPATRSPLRISLTSSSWARARTSCPPSALRSKRQRKRASPKNSCCSTLQRSRACTSRLSTMSPTTRMVGSRPSPPTSRASPRASRRPSSRI